MSHAFDDPRRTRHPYRLERILEPLALDNWYELILRAMDREHWSGKLRDVGYRTELLNCRGDLRLRLSGDRGKHHLPSSIEVLREIGRTEDVEDGAYFARDARIVCRLGVESLHRAEKQREVSPRARACR